MVLWAVVASLRVNETNLELCIEAVRGSSTSVSMAGPRTCAEVSYSLTNFFDSDLGLRVVANRVLVARPDSDWDGLDR